MGLDKIKPNFKNTLKAIKNTEQTIQTLKHISRTPKSIKDIRKWQRETKKNLKFLNKQLTDGLKNESEVASVIAKSAELIKWNTEKIGDIYKALLDNQNQFGKFYDHFDKLYISINNIYDNITTLLDSVANLYKKTNPKEK